MLDGSPIIPSGDPGDDADAALWTALAAADDDMLTAITNRLDLDTGLARVFKDLDSLSVARACTQEPAQPGDTRTRDTTLPSAHDLDPEEAFHLRLATVIRNVNRSNAELGDLYLRIEMAADVARRYRIAADDAAGKARTAEGAFGEVQVTRPHRRGSFPRQSILAFGTVILDGLICYFAGRAMGGGRTATLIWTGLFLAILAGGEIALDFYSDRGAHAGRAVRLLTGCLLVLLGCLRLWFLLSAGTGLVSAVAGASVFTAVTAGFLFVGYRALRAAETPAAWRARRHADQAGNAAQIALAAADRAAATRDRLIDAYVRGIRRDSLFVHPAVQQIAIESALRQHLLEALSVSRE